MMPISAALRGGVCLALYALAAACGGSAIPIAGGIVDRSYAHKRLLWQNGLAGLKLSALRAATHARLRFVPARACTREKDSAHAATRRHSAGSERSAPP